MKKYSITLPQTAAGFGSLVTKYPSDSLQVKADDLTGNSFNVDTTKKGVVTKRPGKVLYNPTPFTNPAKDQYEAIFADGVHHLLEVDSGVLKYSSGDRIFHNVTSGYSSTGNFEFTMYQDRVYFSNGIDPVQVYDRTTTYGGVTYTVPRTKDAGAQPPGSPVTFNADSSGGNVPNGSHTYVVTFLYYGSEESNGGPVSAVHTVSNPNHTVNITNVPIGGYGVTARKIYRDNNDQNWLLIGEIDDNTTTTFTDTESVGTTLLPIDSGIPPTGAYIVEHLDRIWISGVAGDQNFIFFSDPGSPDLFPGANFILCNPKDPVTSLIVYNDAVWVFNRNSLGKIAGRTSDEFRYVELPGSIGCVDNRSLQIRTIDGVPTLVWLSDKGFYQTNGSSVTYISDNIEDLVNLNIQQAQQVKGRNAQSTQADFQAGTPSPGIDLTSDPGFITTPNPKRVWQDQTDWEGGSTTDNIATQDGTNTLKVPVAFNPVLADGTLSGSAAISGSNLVLTPNVPYTGNSWTSRGGITTFSNPTSDGPQLTAGAERFQTPRAGTLIGIDLPVLRYNTSIHKNFYIRIYSDLFGLPNTLISSTTIADITTYPLYYVSGTLERRHVIQSVSLSVPAGFFWLVIESVDPNTTFTFGGDQSIAPGSPNFAAKSSGTWVSGTAFITINPVRPGSFTFDQTPVSGSGSWVSNIYDSASIFCTFPTIVDAATFPAGTSDTIVIDGSNSSSFNILEDPTPVTQTAPNLNGSLLLSIQEKRYWKLTANLSTTDDRISLTLGTPELRFNPLATWISEVVDATSDITEINALNLIATIPAGTTVTLAIATSSDNITYPEGFVPFTTLGASYDSNEYDTDPYDAALVIPRRYIKVRAILNATPDDLTTPIVTSITLKWTIVANLISSIIDTGTTPAGWDVFQSSTTLNGGLVNYEMRSASTSLGIPGATFYPVTNGSFPPTGVAPLQFAQWRVTLSSGADHVPTIDSVTVNWFIGNTTSIRVASLFFDKTYYLAAAELGQTTNNLLLVWDRDEKWRVWKGLNINTFSLFFNSPYFGSATENEIFQFANGLTDAGDPIEFNLQTKALNYGKDERIKVPRKIYVTGLNTGASYQFYYSIDEGSTWVLFKDATTGATTITTTADGSRFVKRLTIPYATLEQGRTLTLRAYNNDTNFVQLHQFVIEAWVREGEVINV